MGEGYRTWPRAHLRMFRGGRANDQEKGTVPFFEGDCPLFLVNVMAPREAV